jgi:hypothetical protein
MNFLLVCEYGENERNPEIIIYKKRWNIIKIIYILLIIHV